MRKLKTVLTSVITAGMLMQSGIGSISAESGNYSDWSYKTFYNSDGSIYAADLSYKGTDAEVYIPEKINGLPVKGVSIVSLLNRKLADEELVFHIPEGCNVTNKYYFYSLKQYNNIAADKLTLVYADGSSETLAPQFESGTQSVPEEEKWDYSIVRVGHGEGAVINRYKGKGSIILVPAFLEGRPVVKVASTLFEGRSTYESVTVQIPYECYNSDLIDNDAEPAPVSIEFEDGCFDGMHSLKVVRCGGYVQLDSGGALLSPEGEYYHFLYDENGESRLCLDAIKNEDKKITVPDSVCGYPVRTVGADGYSGDSIWEVSGCDLTLPDSITSFNYDTFFNAGINSVNIPEKVTVLPDGCFCGCKELTVIKGLDHVRFISDTAAGYPTDEGDNRERLSKLLPEDKTVRFNYFTYDYSKPFIVTDTKSGRAYRISAAPDGSLSAELIYTRDDSGEYPAVFMGMPVTVGLLKDIPRGNDIVIHEGTSRLEAGDISYIKDDLFDEASPAYNMGRVSADKPFDELLRNWDNALIGESENIIIYSKDLTVAEKAFEALKCSSYDFPGSANIYSQGAAAKEAERLVFSGKEPDIILNDHAFENCTKLAELTFPEKCHDLVIGNEAFTSGAFSSLTIPEGSSSIGDRAFEKSSRLETVTVNGSPVMGACVFNECDSLREVSFNSSPKMTTGTFLNCLALKNINADLSADLEGGAFNGCTHLDSINGEYPYNEDGSPKEKYRDFIERNFKASDNNGIVDRYVEYRIKETVADIISDDMADIVKVKTIHDKVCSMVDYDYGNIDDPKNHADVSVFLNDTSVCEGYARAMNLMLHEAGIESCYVNTDNHAWVIVKLGDHCFHADPTWDDGENINYDWFLKSDSQIDGKDSHTDWTLECPSPLHTFQWGTMPECKDIMGDVDGNNIIDGRDATAILTSYARASVGGKEEVDGILADFNWDGIVDGRALLRC